MLSTGCECVMLRAKLQTWHTIWWGLLWLKKLGATSCFVKLQFNLENVHFTNYIKLLYIVVCWKINKTWLWLSQVKMLPTIHVHNVSKSLIMLSSSKINNWDAFSQNDFRGPTRRRRSWYCHATPSWQGTYLHASCLRRRIEPTPYPFFTFLHPHLLHSLNDSKYRYPNVNQNLLPRKYLFFLMNRFAYISEVNDDI